MKYIWIVCTTHGPIGGVVLHSPVKYSLQRSLDKFCVLYKYTALTPKYKVYENRGSKQYTVFVCVIVYYGIFFSFDDKYQMRVIIKTPAISTLSGLHCRLCDTENKGFPEKIGSNFIKWFVPGRNLLKWLDFRYFLKIYFYILIGFSNVCLNIAINVLVKILSYFVK